MNIVDQPRNVGEITIRQKISVYITSGTVEIGIVAAQLLSPGIINIDVSKPMIDQARFDESSCLCPDRVLCDMDRESVIRISSEGGRKRHSVCQQQSPSRVKRSRGRWWR